MKSIIKKTSVIQRICVLLLFLGQAIWFDKSQAVLGDEKGKIVELYRKKSSTRKSAAHVFEFPWQYSSSENDSAYFTPSGNYLVTSSYPANQDCTSIAKWNLRTGVLDKVFAIEGKFIDQIQVSSDDKWMIVTTRLKHQTSLWNFETGVSVLTCYDANIDDLHFYGSSSDMLWHKRFDEIKTVGISNHEILSSKVLRGSGGELYYYSTYGHSRFPVFHKKGIEYLLKGHNQTLLKVNAVTDRQKDYRFKNSIKHFCASDDLSRIAAITDQDEVEVIDGVNGRSIYVEKLPEGFELVGITPNGQELFLLGPSGNFESRGIPEGNKVVLSDLHFSHRYQCYAFSKDLRLSVCGVGNDRFDLIDTETGTRLIRFLYSTDSNSWQCESFDGFVIRSSSFLGSIDDVVVENPSRIGKILESFR